MENTSCTTVETQCTSNCCPLTNSYTEGACPIGTCFEGDCTPEQCAEGTCCRSIETEPCTEGNCSSDQEQDEEGVDRSEQEQCTDGTCCQSTDSCTERNPCAEEEIPQIPNTPTSACDTDESHPNQAQDLANLSSNPFLLDEFASTECTGVLLFNEPEPTVLIGRKRCTRRTENLVNDYLDQQSDSSIHDALAKLATNVTTVTTKVAESCTRFTNAVKNQWNNNVYVQASLMALCGYFCYQLV